MTWFPKSTWEWSGLAVPISVELSDGTSVVVQTSAPLTSDTFDELLDFLEVYKRILQKRAAKADQQAGRSD